MITILAKKIKAEINNKRDNFVRANMLVDYCSKPESSNRDEKCVSFRVYNFSEENPSIERVKIEFRFDMEKPLIKSHELLSHWIISWRGGEPPEREIFDAAQELMTDLGYTDSNRMIIAIHADTDNIHAHVCVCKADSWTTRITNEGGGWWKRESQKSLARIAHNHNWNLERGALFRVRPNPRREIATIETINGPKEITRLIVESVRRDGLPSISASSANFERRSKKKSTQRQLQEALADFLVQYYDRLANWKIEDFHRTLAEYGIDCQRQQHGTRYGLVYSLDGEMYESATRVCPQLAYSKLMKTLNGAEWKDALPETAGTLRVARTHGIPYPALCINRQAIHSDDENCDFSKNHHLPVMEASKVSKTSPQKAEDKKHRSPKKKFVFRDVPLTPEMASAWKMEAEKFWPSSDTPISSAEWLMKKAAKCLYGLGANPDQVHTFLTSDIARNLTIKANEIKRLARKITLALSPISFIGANSAWREKRQKERPYSHIQDVASGERGFYGESGYFTLDDVTKKNQPDVEDQPKGSQNVPH